MSACKILSEFHSCTCVIFTSLHECIWATLFCFKAMLETASPFGVIISRTILTLKKATS